MILFWYKSLVLVIKFILGDTFNFGTEIMCHGKMNYFCLSISVALCEKLNTIREQNLKIYTFWFLWNTIDDLKVKTSQVRVLTFG